MPRDVRSITHAYRERLAHGAVRSEHVVHFFDDDAARERVVTAFVRQALLRRQSVLTVARPALWTRVDGRLRHDRVAVSADARLVVLDAGITLGAMMRQGRFEPGLFAEMVEPLVTDLAAASPAGLSVYGEMVDIVASEGNFTAARDLEAAWNTLMDRVSITLLCGYASAHFAVGERETMSMICGAHTRIETDASDALGRWLVHAAEAEPVRCAS